MGALPDANLSDPAVQPRTALLDAGGVMCSGLDDVCLVAHAELNNGRLVAIALLPDAGHQVASLLQQVGFMVAALLDDAAEQRLSRLLDCGKVVVADLADVQLLFAGDENSRLVQVAAGEIGVVQQIKGGCRPAVQGQGKKCGKRSMLAFHPISLGLFSGRFLRLALHFVVRKQRMLWYLPEHGSGCTFRQIDACKCAKASGTCGVCA